MPMVRASSSMWLSSAQLAWGAVGARTEPDGWWFVYARCAWISTAGRRYGPIACMPASSGKKPASAVYAPLSIRIFARRAVSVPSFRTPVSSSMTMPSRRWSGAMNSSRREKTSFAGRFALRATAATCASKWNSHLPPKPPPRWGTITRTWFSAICSVWATPARALNGTCVDDQMVT